MNKIRLSLTLLWPLVCLAGDGFKPLDIKPGLWETSITSQVSGMPPLPADVLARLTPEQRARMEEAVKTRAASVPQTRVQKSCLTSEQLSKPLALGEDADTCKRTVVSSSSTKEEVHVECINGEVKSTGDIRVEAVTSESIKGTSEVSTTEGSRTMSVSVSFSGKWLGAECADLKKK